jgi:CheY-like chemotaxis protein
MTNGRKCCRISQRALVDSPLVSPGPALTLLRPNPAWSAAPWRRAAQVRQIAHLDDMLHAMATAAIAREPVERVIIEGPIEGTSLLRMLTKIPPDVPAEILIVASRERAFVSRVEEGQRKLLAATPEIYVAGEALERLRVLVAEDERKTREFIAAVLESIGCEALQARAGMEAIRFATERRPQLLLLDGLLPEMAGFEISRFVRTMDAAYRPRIVMVTAVYKDNRYRSEAKLKYGVDQYLVKPVTADQIANAIFGEIVAHV